MDKKRCTIKDLAKVAGVSTSTVSRALNDHFRTSEKTKQKVQKIAREMGYTPNLLARGLVSKKKFLIGLLVYDFQNPFYSELTQVIQNVLAEMGYWAITSNTDDDPTRARIIVDSMLKLGVGGLIFASCQLQDELVEGLLEKNFPVMLVNRRLQEDRSNYVVIDNEYGAYLVVNHLIRLGYKRIAIITGPKTTSTGRDRHRGYLEAVNDKGLEVIPELVKEGRFFSQSTGYDNTKLLMSQNSPPEAIFCSDDHIALGAMWALAEMDLNVPSDVALVGFDDVWISSHPRIQLTTVSQDVAEMGRLAGKIIVDTLEGRLEEPKRIYLEPNLKIRSSCGYRLRAGQKNNPD